MLKKTLFSILTLILLLVIAIAIFLYSKKPNYKGNEHLSGLKNAVEVYYDDYGIPHIFAESEEDAMMALGYAQAHDRLFQMEVLSRIAPGRLSEIFGDKLIETDKFFLSLGINENSEKVLSQLDKNAASYKMAEAFLKGVNQYVAEGKTPLEFTILGIKKHDYTLQDIQNVFGYMSFGFAMAHKTDPLVSAIKEKLGDEYVKNLGLNIDPNSTLIKTYPVKDAVEISKAITYLDKVNPIPSFIGSNSWVLGTQKTKNGKVIFENDPHIGYSQPGTWFQAHIKTPKHESYGFYLALTPFPLLSHNRSVAYGLTMFENDDIDLYIEKLNPNNPEEYLVDSTYHPLKKRNYKIKVKGADEVDYTVYETHRGPIINKNVPEVKTSEPVSMYWVFMHRANKLLELVYGMSRANNIDEFKKFPPLLHAPGLNIMYGDIDGNVAWWASGHLYERANNPVTKMMLDGTNSLNDSIDYFPFSENPQAINPEWNYVYSCNNQPDSIVSKRYVPGYYLPQNRSKRVVELVSSKNDWTQTEVENMALDITSPVNVDLNRILIQSIGKQALNETENKALAQLKSWDGKASTNSVGQTIFNQFIYEYYKAMLEDEMGQEIFNQFLNTHLEKRMFEPLMKGTYGIWADDITTKTKKESVADIQLQAFKNTAKRLENALGNDVSKWTWGKVHTVEYKHPFGEIKLLRPYFNVGPFEIAGTNEVINNQIFNISEAVETEVTSGPSTRRIIDFSNVEGAKAILPTGNSGNVLSPHYKDQAQLFIEGKFVPMLINEEKIKSGKNVLKLVP